MGKKKKKWRKVVKKRMKKATLHEAAKRYRTEYPIFNYRWEHVKSVVKLSLKLAELTGADAEVVEAAAWLHDVAKQKAKGDHPEVGAKIARKVLSKTDFPQEKIESVAYAIEMHMGLWRDKPLKNLEAAVLWDADKLAKIGLTAAFHWMGAEFARESMVTTSGLVSVGQAVDWHDKTVESMHTEPAKRAAASRLKRYTKLWEELDMELKAEDLK
ncbi:MAG: HD domain-containing protein [Anaerolineales bacterium]|nr:HD domain-containing protein [Anaerolineales bacterium]